MNRNINVDIKVGDLSNSNSKVRGSNGDKLKQSLKNVGGYGSAGAVSGPGLSNFRKNKNMSPLMIQKTMRGERHDSNGAN